MFKLDEIRTAHSKVKSGADFPAYIRELKKLGVTAYETWVKDSHTDYMGENGYRVSSEPKYAEKAIAPASDKETFTKNLKIHQQGGTDYPTFCSHCAEAGIEKWFVDLSAMTCTYFDTSGEKILEEQIPS